MGSTTTSKATKGKARPADTCRLELVIRGERYAVRPIPPGWHSTAYRLRKADGTTYHVTSGEHGPACECGDFQFRRDGIDPEGCKHVRALRAVGLIDAGPAGASPNGDTLAPLIDEDGPPPRRPHPCPHCPASIPADTSTCPRCGKDEFEG